jgi:hypothetical protein
MNIGDIYTYNNEQFTIIAIENGCIHILNDRIGYCIEIEENK